PIGEFLAIELAVLVPVKVLETLLELLPRHSAAPVDLLKQLAKLLGREPAIVVGVTVAQEPLERLASRFGNLGRVDHPVVVRVQLHEEVAPGRRACWLLGGLARSKRCNGKSERKSNEKAQIPSRSHCLDPRRAGKGSLGGRMSRFPSTRPRLVSGH